jgi:3'-phosphoadenosine 5'-phosphosulfate sulfotransferase (PAPS reductase)/FAD synthetase
METPPDNRDLLALWLYRNMKSIKCSPVFFQLLMNPLSRRYPKPTFGCAPATSAYPQPFANGMLGPRRERPVRLWSAPQPSNRATEKSNPETLTFATKLRSTVELQLCETSSKLRLRRAQKIRPGLDATVTDSFRHRDIIPA